MTSELENPGNPVSEIGEIAGTPVKLELVGKTESLSGQI